MELVAATLAVKTYLKEQVNKHALLLIGNQTAVAYMNNLGGTVSTQTTIRYVVPGERNCDFGPISPGRREHQSGQRVVGDEGLIRQLDAESLDLSENLEAFSGPQHHSVSVPPILPALAFFSWKPDPLAEATDAFL